MFISRSKDTKYMNTPLSHKSVILHFGMKNHTKVDYVKKCLIMRPLVILYTCYRME